jgi:hypothetical protein
MFPFISPSVLDQLICSFVSIFTFLLALQPFAKMLAVTDLGDFENKQSKIDPSVGISVFQPSCSGSPPSAA